MQNVVSRMLRGVMLRRAVILAHMKTYSGAEVPIMAVSRSELADFTQIMRFLIIQYYLFIRIRFKRITSVYSYLQPGLEYLTSKILIFEQNLLP
jgi:hypothetical protein